jgi:hypothetical protein
LSDDVIPAVDVATLAKEAADQLTAIKGVLESAKQEMAKAKGAIEEIQRTATADSDTITKTKQEIEKLRLSATTSAETLQAEHAGITDEIEKLEQEKITLSAVVNEIAKLRDEASSDGEAAAESVKAIQESKKAFDGLRAEAQSAHDDLKSKHSDVDEAIAEINKGNDAVKEIYNALFTDEGEKKSIKTAISDLHERIGTTLVEAEAQNKDQADAFDAFKKASIDEKEELLRSSAKGFADLQEKLEGQILSLLPSAGAAGLASTYYDAKAKYSVTPFHPNPLRVGSWFQRKFGQDPTSLVSTIFFYVMFLGPIATIIWLFFDLLHDLATLPAKSISDRYLIFRTLIAVPLGTVSLFGYTSLRLHRRLYEEYNYKQRVMELYTSFSKEIEEKGDEDQKKALLAIMLKAVADKPSLSMHRYDGVGQSTGIKIDVGAFINRFLGTPKV